MKLKNMKNLLLCNTMLFAMLCLLAGCGGGNGAEPVLFQTICNPIDLSYRFCLDTPSRREAADPSVVLFEGEYYMFASKSGGYFHSTDLVTWNLITSDDLPLENYAPAAVVIRNEIYFITSGCPVVYKTAFPKTGKWEVVTDKFAIHDTDPALFLDDDGRLYYYAGCSDVKPTVAVELNPVTFDTIGPLVELVNSDRKKYGWEVPGTNNEDDKRRPWVEGCWMNKYKGRYYLQYANPGTKSKSYNDAVYVSGYPLGPFTIAEHNPFAYKPEGFIAGVGHGCTFQDKYGNYWHMGTSTISVRHVFERRLSLHPVFFDEACNMYACTVFGDYPLIVPDKKVASPEELFPGWMLLSYGKPVHASSTLDEAHAPENAANEDIRTWWSAQTGSKDEWLAMDLGAVCDVYALQINFADQDATSLGRADDIYYEYTVEKSTDSLRWEPLVDRSRNAGRDAPHDYIRLPKPSPVRFLRIVNGRVPSGKFALSGLRVFG
ncbi:MAG: family 43 glycosylhydrolase, partial [Bacteroidales bacterium]|nr:family 43 glycosylhydrolase [Bacteroidales bacterium]